jgi:hypothetical protein
MGRYSRGQLVAPVAQALRDGWQAEELVEYLSRNVPADVRAPVPFLRRRLDDLPTPRSKQPKKKGLPPLCGQCDNRWVEDDDGALHHCPRCHPKGHEQR